MFDRRAKACGMGSAGSHHLARAIHMVKGEVAAKADDMAAAGIGDLPAFVGQAPQQGLGRYVALPWQMVQCGGDHAVILCGLGGGG
jgi:hypothetical protein